MKKYSSAKDTKKHIRKVRGYLLKIIWELFKRALSHDKTKLSRKEKPIFDIYTPKLKETTYGSPEYSEFLKEMNVALSHHYAKNRHHPEHFINGIKGMNLVDVVEMFCDWLAATKRHADGNIFASIAKNKKRFNYETIQAFIFENTAYILGEME
jgi:hypothetical protein